MIAESVRVDTLAPGLVHSFFWMSRGPWAIQVLDVDRSACWRTVALKNGHAGFTRVTVRDLVQAFADTTRDVVAGGINADFFALDTGVPNGLMVSGGRTLNPPGTHPALAFDRSGQPWIGPGTALPFAPAEAIGGFPVLLADSVPPGNLETTGSAHLRERNPRTAVGTASGGRRLLFVTVDGRQPHWSDGMTLPELVALMRALGARDAINFDGGGSTTMVINRGGVMGTLNRPSDATGERPVANAFALVRRACAWKD